MLAACAEWGLFVFVGVGEVFLVSSIFDPSVSFLFFSFSLFLGGSLILDENSQRAKATTLSAIQRN